jgi:hypothetical protein
MNVLARILLVLFVISVSGGVQAAGVWYTPYHDRASNLSYNQLFCDDLSLYNNQHKGPWQVLFAQPANLKNLQTLANSVSAETRLRILAFNALTQHKVAPKHKELLGVIVEVGLEHGLKTLAAYQDLHIRYLNQNGKLLVWEQRDPDIDAKIHKLFQETQPIIEKIGPWGKPRLPPPDNGQVRLSFLVNDGLYFGQGTMGELARSPLAGPVVTAATELLFALSQHEAASSP